MNRDEVLDALKAHRDTLAEGSGVTNLALFGSCARDQTTYASDIDILARFDLMSRYGCADGVDVPGIGRFRVRSLDNATKAMELVT